MVRYESGVIPLVWGSSIKFSFDTLFYIFNFLTFLAFNFWQYYFLLQDGHILIAVTFLLKCKSCLNIQNK